jgi:hypothetical protein
MIWESAMYAPFFVPLVPCQAAIPPPHARFANITFWNQLFQKLPSEFSTCIKVPLRSPKSEEILSVISNCNPHQTSPWLTISLTIYDTVNCIRKWAMAREPGTLPASKGAAIERSVRINDGGDESLSNRISGLNRLGLTCKEEVGTHCTIFKVNIICFEISVSELLTRDTCNSESCGLLVRHPVLDI